MLSTATMSLEDSGASPCAANGVSHAIEDALVLGALAAFGLNERVSHETLLDILDLLLNARREGREHELLARAHSEAATIPDWDCPYCIEINPGTFESCWNCGQSRSAGSTRMSAQSEILLEIESAVSLGLVREQPAVREENSLVPDEPAALACPESFD